MIEAPAEAVHRLWDDLADFSPTQTEWALDWLMAGLVERTGASNAVWIGAVRMGNDETDVLSGWRVGSVKTLHPIVREKTPARFDEILRKWQPEEPDLSVRLSLLNVCTFRNYAFRRDLPASWFDSLAFHLQYRSQGFEDAVFVAFPMNSQCESHFGFYFNEPISKGAIARVTYALRGIKWFHRQIMLGRGLLLASDPLTPIEHSVLQRMLAKASVRSISLDLGMADADTRHHLASILRKFGVRSRAGLMSVWLNPPMTSIPVP